MFANFPMAGKQNPHFSLFWCIAEMTHSLWPCFGCPVSSGQSLNSFSASFGQCLFVGRFSTVGFQQIVCFSFLWPSQKTNILLILFFNRMWRNKVGPPNPKSLWLTDSLWVDLVSKWHYDWRETHGRRWFSNLVMLEISLSCNVQGMGLWQRNSLRPGQ